MTQLWRNWSGDQRCAPEAIEHPADESQLAQLVVAAATRGTRVRAVGSGHSFTDCACTDGLMLDLSRMDAILAVEGHDVTVQAGIKLHELGARLAARGLALENQGDIDRQSLAGALSTGTHGTGIGFANLSSRVVGMRVVGADGEARDLTGDDLRAGRVSLGALGVISTVTLRAVPAYTLHRNDAPVPLERTLIDLQDNVDEHDHFEFWVFPYTRRARATHASQRAAPDATPPWKRFVQEDLLENRALGALCRVGRRLPRATPLVNRVVAAAMSAGYVEDASHLVYATKRNVRFNEMEYSIERGAAAEAVQRVLELVRRRRLPILFPLEVRFSKADDALLSAAHDRDSCFVAVHQFVGMEFESYFRAVEQIMLEYGGRPHWGKCHYLDAAALAERYPQWQLFQDVRRRLDPGCTFANDYVERVLGT